VITNLINNIVDHSQATRALIGVRLRPTGDVEVQIIDNGIGISLQEQELIFKPGYSGNIGRSTKENSGLGLSVVYELAQELGASVRLRSELRRGTVFSIVLPGPISWSQVQDAPVIQTETDLQSRLVVLLDDQPSVIQSLTALFQARGAAVLGYSDVDTLLGNFDVFPVVPALFVLDFSVGHVFADDVIDAVLMRFKEAGSKVAILSGHVSHPRLRRFRELVPIFCKPLSEKNSSELCHMAAYR
jgi:hypothetical protein